MSTQLQTFYNSTALPDSTVSGQVAIRKFTEAYAEAGNDTTITAHPSAAGTTSITAYPLQTNSVQSSNAINAGWIFNVSGVDGIGSTSGALRVIPAGTWRIVVNTGVPVAGTATGTLSVTFTSYIYRVQSGGARVLLGSATSTAVASNAIAAAVGNCESNPSLSEVVLLAGETVMVGYVVNCTQVAGLLGATVAGNIIFALNTVTGIIVPAPGIRTRYPQTLADTTPSVTDTLSALSFKRRTLIDTAAVTDTLSRTTAYKRTLTDAAAVTETIKTVSIFNRTLTDNLSGGTTTYVRPVLIFEE